MKDYIDRKKALNESYTVLIDGEPFQVVQVETLIGLPSADVIPAEWIEGYKKRHYGNWKALSLNAMLDEWKSEKRKEE